MANDMTAGAKKLVERILLDAQSEADASVKEANEKAAEIREKGEKKLEKLKEEQSARVEETKTSILERSRTSAQLSARKSALTGRRKVIDDAFKATYAALGKMDDAKRGEILKAMLLQEADGGEAVFAGKFDKDTLKAMIADVNASLKAQGKAPLATEVGSADVEYGFLLKGDGYEKDCSFLALLRDIRASEESKVAAILFE